MAEKKPTRRTGRASQTLTAEERAAMKETIAERKRGSANGESDVLEKIAAMPEADRVIAERLHAIVSATAPHLTPRTWYGMPAYTNADGKVVCFFQAASKFKTRYLTLGFSDKAALDDGNMWATSYAVKKLTGAEEKRIRALLKQAVD